ncbi:MAG: SMP-30/gluconolactonase/LRE family protein [Mycobacterium sp.]|uniref:SMP-30/gluconolactonase/LRE family protein n=1 Tax=Mycobacterium sp. TaxID=1785 RepID=UPI003CC5EB7B
MATTAAPSLQRLPVGGQGPEDVAILGDRLVTGVADGRVLSFNPDGTDIAVVADTGGRPLGIEAMPDGRLLVCDAERGLLRVNVHGGAVHPLNTAIHGQPINLCNNAAVTADGTIYFTDSSRHYGLDAYQSDVIERTASGRLMRRDPAGEVQVVLDQLEFANGVALADDESFVAVAETGAARVLRVWLTGPHAGQVEVFVDDLPGMPDNLSTGTEGRIWVAIAAPMVSLLHLVHRAPRRLRRLIGRAATSLNHPPTMPARVLAVDRDGDIVGRIEGARRCGYRMVTGVREFNGSLYLGSIVEDAVAVLSPVPPVNTDQVVTVRRHR